MLGWDPLIGNLNWDR